MSIEILLVLIMLFACSSKNNSLQKLSEDGVSLEQYFYSQS
jgi:hypothetical protein